MVNMADRPNILLILTDQERYDLTGDPTVPVETPHLDQLANAGVTFSRAYTPISICSSARASLLTGVYPHNHGLLNNTHGADAVRTNLPLDTYSFGTVLRESGYEVTYTGKWHLGDDHTPESFGFRYLGGSDQFHDNIDTDYQDYRDELGVHVPASALEDPIRLGTPQGEIIGATDPVDVEATRPYFIAQRTIDNLDELAAADDPFFHRTDFLGPHHPYIVPEPYASMYDPATIEPWASYAETFDGKPQAHENYVSYRGVGEYDWETWAALIAKYWGFMTLVDDQIGRILEALDERGLTDETVVIHSSDHGDFIGNHRQFNKGPLMYEDTYRIPLHVRWPEVAEPGVCSDFVQLHDLMPTFLDIAEIPVPPMVDGRSLRPLLAGESAPAWREAAFCEYHGDEFGLYSQRMIRTDAYKFVYNAPDINELYDMEADPAELQNVIDHPAYQEIRVGLENRLLSWMDETDDPLWSWTQNALA